MTIKRITPDLDFPKKEKRAGRICCSRWCRWLVVVVFRSAVMCSPLLSQNIFKDGRVRELAVEIAKEITELGLSCLWLRQTAVVLWQQ